MFVIRSMTTTDYVPAYRGTPAQQSRLYHIYLLPRHERIRAYWGSIHRAERFETEEAAIAECNRLFANDKYGKPQVVPVDADTRGIPPFWAK